MTDHPNGGVGPKLWTGSGISGYTVIARPATPVLLRFYRSAEGYNYTEPRCVVGTSPVSRLGQRPSQFLGAWLTNYSPGWLVGAHGIGSNPDTAFWNYTAVVIKRVSSTTWLELRWSALSHGMALAENSFVANAPYAFELWCSHNASGVLGATRLATWDYTSVVPSTVTNVPYDSLTQLMYLEATLLDDVVTWAMWTEYPGPRSAPADSSSRIEQGSYTLPAALITLVGSAVGGKPGVSMRVDNPNGADYDSTASWFYTAINVPFVHYMEFVDANWAGNVIEIPVIGDADDTPPLITISGLITDPVIAFLVPQQDGTYRSIRLMLEGTIAAGDSVTIDLSAGGTIVDSQGNNRYDMLRPGSRLPMLKPGINKVSLAAINWDATLPKHLSVSWRDALV